MILQRRTALHLAMLSGFLAIIFGVFAISENLHNNHGRAIVWFAAYVVFMILFLWRSLNA
ncbi:MAG: hypothetical protein A3A97_00325 [Candidatus Terrybacteria bacterium RIFCSPLOWO2_01_FULL_40_23]|uniref:Uncharacterized protein n=1 Tax=Candidatus Terrybacteria bacterium RIFCSPLOWO2_01_FULL_40_23 TaxID=1802366 RepID=A0A1G2PU70_9BACT|nr:MAG: hypothetical protein A3A97_00325 [Candidatus Terrybacteria bacterium RIFCSPLOWO2_01_FULL_40_23]